MHAHAYVQARGLSPPCYPPPLPRTSPSPWSSLVCRLRPSLKGRPPATLPPLSAPLMARPMATCAPPSPPRARAERVKRAGIGSRSGARANRGSGGANPPAPHRVFHLPGRQPPPLYNPSHSPSVSPPPNSPSTRSPVLPPPPMVAAPHVGDWPVPLYKGWPGASSGGRRPHPGPTAGLGCSPPPAGGRAGRLAVPPGAVDLPVGARGGRPRGGLVYTWRIRTLLRR